MFVFVDHAHKAPSLVVCLTCCRMDSSIPGNPTEPPGAILIDGLLQSFLLGTIVNQAFKYWLDSWNTDSWHKRTFVTTVILLAT